MHVGRHGGGRMLLLLTFM